MDGFPLPFFYDYPPYYTLQPVKESRDKQSQLWGDLVLAYCRHKRIYAINVEDSAFELFSNAKIGRKLNVEAQRAFLGDLAAQGSAEWVDPKAKRECLVLWRKLPEWAAQIHEFARTYGLADSVMTVDELRSGDDVRGTELFGLHREVLVRALRVLEAQGKAKLFSGETPEEEGVKFL
ncbi:hypothetical protein FOA52_002794 [Chlamydomonas sp. UWO 241]|nr:hypothetical protein FOA52_002794 [Chlamydomonas sp. UWO 241]